MENVERIEHMIITYKNKSVKVKDIMFEIKKNDSISSSHYILYSNDFVNIVNLINIVQHKKYNYVLFGEPLTIVLC